MSSLMLQLEYASTTLNFFIRPMEYVYRINYRYVLRRVVAETGNRGDISSDMMGNCYQNEETMNECLYINDVCEIISIINYVKYCFIWNYSHIRFKWTMVKITLHYLKLWLFIQNCVKSLMSKYLEIISIFSNNMIIY